MNDEEYHFWYSKKQHIARRWLKAPDCLCDIGGETQIYTMYSKNRDIVEQNPCEDFIGAEYLGEGTIITDYSNHNRHEWDSSFTEDQP